MARAHGSYALAKSGKSEGVFLEDLCFQAQQAAEKAVNAVLISKQIIFRYVHDLDELLAAAAKTGIEIPQKVRKSVELTDYAFQTRYPGNYEPVTEGEYGEALEAAEQVLAWAESVIAGQPPSEAPSQKR
jgi:HEPN domain-containing protein